MQQKNLLIGVVIAIVVIVGGAYAYNWQKDGQNIMEDKVQRGTTIEETSSGDAMPQALPENNPTNTMEEENTENPEGATDSMTQDGEIAEGDSMAESVKTINLTGKNFAFSQNEIRVKKGDRVKIVLTSQDGLHDWVVDEFNAATEQVMTSNTSSVEFVADKVGTFEYYCSVGRHREMGMKGNLIIEE